MINGQEGKAMRVKKAVSPVAWIGPDFSRYKILSQGDAFPH